MSDNLKELLISGLSGLNCPSVPHLTVWEADVEEADPVSAETTARRSIRFVSENSDLSSDVFEFANKIIDLETQNEKLMKVAFEPTTERITRPAPEPRRRIVGLRALFDAEPLPFMQHSKDEESKPGDRTFPANFNADTEKWAKLAEDDTYRPARIELPEDRPASAQGAFAELIKNAARRVLIDQCNEDKDRKLSDYGTTFFGEMSAEGLPAYMAPMLEVRYRQSNTDPVGAECTLRIPVTEVQNAIAEILVSSNQADGTFWESSRIPGVTYVFAPENQKPFGSLGPQTVDEFTEHLIQTNSLPSEITKAISAVEEIVRDWAVSPQPGLLEVADAQLFPVSADK